MIGETNDLCCEPGSLYVQMNLRNYFVVAMNYNRKSFVTPVVVVTIAPDVAFAVDWHLAEH